MKMHGVKPKKMMGLEMAKNERMMPRITLDFSTLPEGKEWEVGDKYRIVLDVEQVGRHIDERKGDEHGYAEFEILKSGGEELKVKRHADDKET